MTAVTTTLSSPIFKSLQRQNFIRERWDNGLFITLVSYYSSIITFSFWLAKQLQGLLMDFHWLVYLVKFSATNFNLQIG